MRRGLDRGGLVGRVRELAVVDRAIAAVLAGGPRLLVVSGEAGIGKTALAAAAASRATAQDFAVAWGRSWEGDIPPGWLWRQVARDLSPEAGTFSWTASRPAESVGQRLADILREVARQRPVAVLLEDLHDAEHADMEVLPVLLRHLGDAPVLTIVTLQHGIETAARHVESLVSTPPTLLDHLALQGLEAEAVEALLERLGADASPRTSERTRAVTAGNPLLVSLLARTDAESIAAALGKEPAEEVRSHVRRQVERLPPATARLLAHLAVLPRTTPPDHLAAMTGEPLDAVLDALVPAEAQGLVESVDGVLRFRHELVRASLHADLPPAQRVRLHAQAAAALRALGLEGPVARALIVHHAFHASFGDGPPDAMLDELVETARVARSAGSHFEAAALLKHAVDAAEVAGAPAGFRGRLLLDLAAEQEAAHQFGEAEQHRQAAAALGRVAGDAEVLGRAAISSARAGLFLGLTREAHVRELEQALDALPPQPTPLRIQVLAHLGASLYWTPERRHGEELARQAVEDARATAEPGAIAVATLALHYVTRGPEHAASRAALAAEGARAADEAGDDDLAVLARSALVVDQRERGAPDGVREALDDLRSCALQRQHAHGRWAVEVHELVSALLAGNGKAAQAHAEAAERLAEGDRARLYLTDLARLMTAVRPLNDAERARVSHRAERLPDVLSWRARALLDMAERGVGGADAELGSVLALLRGPGLAGAHWLLAAALAAEAASALGDAGRAGTLRELLLPHADSYVVASRAGACRGHVRYHLGLLALTAGAADVAVDDLEKAIALHQAAGMHALVPRSRQALLRAREALGSPDRKPLGVLVREGAYWSLQRSAGMLTLPDSKGLRYLALLVGSPHEPISALALVRIEAGGGGPGSVRDDGLGLDGGGSDAVLDATAKRAYRARLDAIAAQLRTPVSAQQRGRLEEEQAALRTTLALGIGLGGRDRRLPSDNERARTSVTKALRAAVGRIREQDAAIARHLDASLRTGARCVYAPLGPGLVVR